jgi:hypothetical protein
MLPQFASMNILLDNTPSPEHPAAALGRINP